MTEAASERCYLLSFEDEGRGRETRNVSERALEARKGKETFSPKASRKTVTLPTPWFQPRKTHVELLAY